MYKINTTRIRKKYGVNFTSGDLPIIGETLEIEGPSQITPSLLLSGNIKIGAFTYFCNGGLVSNINIGRYCSVATDVKIGLGDHPTNWLSTSPFQYLDNVYGWAKHLKTSAALKAFTPFKTVKIGNDVWIGAGVTIRDGITVGDGAVIGANSIVTKDVPPYAIVVGSPAKILKYRFDEETIQELLELKWWRFSLKDLNGVDFDDIKKAVSEIKEREAKGEISEYKPEIVTREILLKNLKKEKFFKRIKKFFKKSTV